MVVEVGFVNTPAIAHSCIKLVIDLGLTIGVHSNGDRVVFGQTFSWIFVLVGFLCSVPCFFEISI